MKNDKQNGRYVNSRLYVYWRKNVAVASSINNKGRIVITNGTRTKRVLSTEIESYIDAGWVYGQFSSPETTAARQNANSKRKGYSWITKDGHSKQVTSDELPCAIADGWIQERIVNMAAAKGKHRIKVNGKCKFVDEIPAGANLESIVSHNLGAKAYNDGHKNIYLLPEDDIPLGFVIGGLPRTNEHLRWFNDGSKNYLIKPSLAGLLTKGRLKWIKTQYADCQQQIP
jgi:hypothetical protein